MMLRVILFVFRAKAIQGRCYSKRYDCGPGSRRRAALEQSYGFHFYMEKNT